MAKINGQWVRVYEPLLWEFTTDNIFVQSDGSIFFGGGDITGGVRVIYGNVTSDWHDIEAYETPSEYHDENILVCYNTVDLGVMGNGESKAIADYYKTFRSDCHFLPLAITSEMCHNTTDVWTHAIGQHMHDEVIYEDYFESQMQAPLASYLSKHPEIHFVVLCKGIPFSIYKGGGWCAGDTPYDYSVAGRLSNLKEEEYGEYGKFHFPPTGSGGWPLHKGMRFRNDLYDFNYVVTWLSGWSFIDITNLIARSFTTRQDKWNDYMWVLDYSGRFPSSGLYINTTRSRLSQIVNPANILVEMSDTNQLEISTTKPVIAYASVGSYEYGHYVTNSQGKPIWHQNPWWLTRSLGFQVAPGAILTSIESHNADHSTEFVKNIRYSCFAQGVIFDSFRSDAGQGVNYERSFSGASGHVREPGLSGVARTYIYMPAYALGFTAAESFQMSLFYRSGSRYVIILGDPLMRIR